MSNNSRWIGACVAMLSTVLLAACTTVNSKHPEVVTGKITEEAKAQLAAVYFIRPKAYKSKDMADRPVRIEFQGKTLLTQDEGTYTLLYIKPSKGVLKVYSKTLFAGQDSAVDVWRSRVYKFIAGKTYFIYVRQIDEEFRGVFYEPQPVSLNEAKQLIVPGLGRFGNTHASGAARSAPIDELTEVDMPPASAVKDLTPALPESLYKQENLRRAK
ncbi:MAG TPA: hypothetical protein ENK04_06205 [Gammaproteobacteria bacterium]|nr:hypothetical protein [Gammaproteobacteria bacterium]